MAVVEDLFSRKTVGWSAGQTAEGRSVADARSMALARRLTGSSGSGLLAHPDRGSQSASDHYRRARREEGVVCSVSGVGQCWDNAPVESLLGRMRCELASAGLFATRDRARAERFEYLEVFYNRVRLHPALGYVSPDAFERARNRTRR